MTKDEAYKAAERGYGMTGSYNTVPRAFVDMAVALGMLKLEEPKSLEQKLADLTEYGHRTLTEWRARLDSAGLKIVEK